MHQKLGLGTMDIRNSRQLQTVEQLGISTVLPDIDHVDIQLRDHKIARKYQRDGC
jgi:hypothetical protein